MSRRCPADRRGTARRGGGSFGAIEASSATTVSAGQSSARNSRRSNVRPAGAE